MSTLWLLVGRGGSRGVPGKNLKRIGALTLVEWKIRAARACDPNAIIVASSDSQDILDEAERAGASFTLKRPDDLATDTASSADVIKHALAQFRGEYDTVALLEPSAPYTRGEDYRRALQMMEFHDADLVVGMRETFPHTSFIGDIRDDMSITPIIMQFQRHARRRQDWPRCWSMNGACYVFKTDMFLRTGDIYGGVRNFGMMMPSWNSIEIDTPEDLEMAEYAYAKGYVKPDGGPCT